MNPFTLVSARVRLWLYGVAGFSGLGLGAVTAYCEAVALPRPTWVVGASAALAVLAAPLFALAASNVVPQVTVAADPPAGLRWSTSSRLSITDSSRHPIMMPMPSSPEWPKVTVEPLDPIVSSEGVTYPQSSDAKSDAAHYDPKHDRD